MINNVVKLNSENERLDEKKVDEAQDVVIFYNKKSSMFLVKNEHNINLSTFLFKWKSRTKEWEVEWWVEMWTSAIFE